LEQIQKELPGFPLVMHGSSSVPQEEVERINAAGGKLSGAKGVDATQFRKAASLGVTKINIDTDGRLVWTRVHREFSVIIPKNLTCATPARFSLQNMPTLLLRRTNTWAALASSQKYANLSEHDAYAADRNSPQHLLGGS